MSTRRFIAIFASIPLLVLGCSHKEQTTTSGSESSSVVVPSAESSAAPAPSLANGPTTTNFNFTDIAITTSGAPVLRLGFDIKNNGKDPLLCDPTEFTIQLSDGTTIPADTSAENTCNPDTVDPAATGKAVMFFDLKSAYAGPVTLIMTANGGVAGKGTAQVH